jgi:hypothetical protein
VVSALNFQPDGFVESGWGVYARNARIRPSNVGSANPAVISTFDRCGSGVVPPLAVMSV